MENLKNLSKEVLNQIIEDYRDNNISLRKLGIKYNINRHKLSEYLTEVGIKTQTGNHYRKYFHDFSYFEKIDCHEKAYWLGFIMADGYITRVKGKTHGEDKVGITLHAKDDEQLYRFREAINATNEVKYYTEKIQKKWIERGCKPTSKVCRILLTSQKTCDDLMSKGVVYNKSLIKEFPDNNQVPDKYIYSYLRGYIDGK